MRKNKYIYQNKSSRKWILVLLVVSLATLGTFIPPIISVWIFGKTVPLVIMSGTEYVSLLTLVVSAYFGSNVFQKRIENSMVQIQGDLDNNMVKIQGDLDNNMTQIQGDLNNEIEVEKMKDEDEGKEA